MKLLSVSKAAILVFVHVVNGKVLELKCFQAHYYCSSNEI